MTTSASSPNQALLGFSFEGHPLALAVLAYVRFGIKPENDQIDPEPVLGALITSHQSVLLDLANDSRAIHAGIAALSAPAMQGMTFTDVVVATSANFLREFGGIVGIEEECDRRNARGYDKALIALGRKQAPTLADLLGANVTTVEIGPDTNIDEALKGVDMPQAMKDKLKALGEAAQTASAEAEAKDKTIN